MIKKVLQLITLALAGYVVYELAMRYFAQQQAAQERSRTIPQPLGSARGAAMTGGSEGVSTQTLGSDGSAVSERVGRGVRPRQG